MLTGHLIFILENSRRIVQESIKSFRFLKFYLIFLILTISTSAKVLVIKVVGVALIIKGYVDIGYSFKFLCLSNTYFCISILLFCQDFVVKYTDNMAYAYVQVTIKRYYYLHIHHAIIL